MESQEPLHWAEAAPLPLPVPYVRFEDSFVQGLYCFQDFELILLTFHNQ